MYVHNVCQGFEIVDLSKLDETYSYIFELLWLYYTVSIYFEKHACCRKQESSKTFKNFRGFSYFFIIISLENRKQRLFPPLNYKFYAYIAFGIILKYHIFYDDSSML